MKRELNSLFPLGVIYYLHNNPNKEDLKAAFTLQKGHTSENLSNRILTAISNTKSYQ